MKLKKVLEDMKNKKREVKNKVIAGTLGMMTSMFLLSTTVMAAGGVDSVTQPLTNLKTLVVSVIAAVGVIILAKNVMEFATAYQQQDSSSMNMCDQRYCSRSYYGSNFICPCFSGDCVVPQWEYAEER